MPPASGVPLALCGHTGRFESLAKGKLRCSRLELINVHSKIRDHVDVVRWRTLAGDTSGARAVLRRGAGLLKRAEAHGVGAWQLCAGLAS